MVLALFFLNLIYSENPGYLIQVNGKDVLSSSSVEAAIGDTILIISSKKSHWERIRPIPREYDNLELGNRSFANIRYSIEQYGDSDTLKFLPKKPGTYLFSNESSILDSINSYKPLHRQYPSIIQITIRENNSYVGYLTELLNLPFVIPPKIIQGYGHQTDLRVGTDCAELAIYGRRRMGYDIPYCGPKGIYEFLIPAQKIQKGTIVHFGHQVSVVYEDLGEQGELDSKDLLIHAFEDRVSIQPFGSTSLIDHTYQVFNWRE